MQDILFQHLTTSANKAHAGAQGMKDGEGGAVLFDNVFSKVSGDEAAEGLETTLVEQVPFAIGNSEAREASRPLADRTTDWPSLPESIEPTNLAGTASPQLPASDLADSAAFPVTTEADIDQGQDTPVPAAANKPKASAPVQAGGIPEVRGGSREPVPIAGFRADVAVSVEGEQIDKAGTQNVELPEQTTITRTLSQSDTPQPANRLPEPPAGDGRSDLLRVKGDNPPAQDLPRHARDIPASAGPASPAKALPDHRLCQPMPDLPRPLDLTALKSDSAPRHPDATSEAATVRVLVRTPTAPGETASTAVQIDRAPLTAATAKDVGKKDEANLGSSRLPGETPLPRPVQENRPPFAQTVFGAAPLAKHAVPELFFSLPTHAQAAEQFPLANPSFPMRDVATGPVAVTQAAPTLPMEPPAPIVAAFSVPFMAQKDDSLAEMESALLTPLGGTSEVKSQGTAAPEHRANLPTLHSTPARLMQAMAETARILDTQRAVEISLHPQELGRVRMHMHGQENAMMVMLTVERPETTDLMRRHIETLAQELREMGYEDVSFGFSTGSGGFASEDSQQENAADQGNAGSAFASSEVSEAPMPPSNLQREVRDGSRLDIRL